jgi:thermostable 8-oxoguanine DNA glycosylase
MLTIDKGFIEKWSQAYNDEYKCDKDEAEEKAIRYWLTQQEEPKYFNKEYFVRLSRLKSLQAVKHFEINDDNEVVDSTKSAYKEPNEVKKLLILMKLVGVGVKCASTIVHYMEPGAFPILDNHIMNTLKEAGLWTRNVAETGPGDWFEYVKIIRGLSIQLNVSLRDLGNALFAYDKREPYCGRE